MITKAGLIPFFKLEKLKIATYKLNTMTKESDTFEAMFNPESFSQTLTNNYATPEAYESSGNEIAYISTSARKLRFKLILDDTTVTDALKVVSFSRSSLTSRIDKFIEDTMKIDGEIHEPRFLKVSWGNYSLNCRIESLDVKYTLFDRGGNALRAELDIAFIEDVIASKKEKEIKRESPDLTHIKVVKKGDTLPMMSKEVYGNPNYYIQVAKHNKLNNYRKLEPGMEIYFPPIEK